VRVLFSSTSGYGHVFPMLPLARAFVAAGHDVRWALSPDSCGHLAGTGIETSPAGPGGAVEHGARRAVLAQAEQVAPEGRAAFVFPRMFGAALMPMMARDLLPLAQEWGPDLLVHENGELAAPLVGAVLGVRSVTHAFGGAIPERLLTEAGERVAPVWAAHGQPLPPYAGCFSSLYLDLCPPSVQSVPADHIGAVSPIRPVADTGQPPSGLPDYLEDVGCPLVYLTLGTVRNRSPVLRTAVDALSVLPVRVLVTVGPDGDPAVLGDQPGNVRVERWVHQPQVLERCSVVVSHAGSGTFLGALAQGLPQLCLPQAADQFRNAEGGLRSGSVLVLRPPEATGDAVAAAVGRLLEEPEFREHAAVVAAEIAGMPSPADVVGALQRRW
jgi:UDP:flavonoid glycosyltransferase YjiC (YdhE family)